jgi:transaldolase
MPLATLRAFVDHGQTTRTLGESSDAAERMLRDAEHAGIDLDAITARLEIEGVQAFCDSYRELLSCVAQVSHSMT